MLFGKYLRRYRVENELTQAQAAIKLNLTGGDLANIDTVSLSRWERGTTKPTITRSIRVLREFTNNLEPYLTELSHEQMQLNPVQERINQFDDVMEEKYNSLNSLVHRANYKTSLSQPHNLICECPILSQCEQNVIQDIHNFHAQTSADNVIHGLQKIDLLDYCANNRLIAYKYVDSMTNNLLGHNIGAIFKSDSFESEVESLDKKTINEIDLRKTTPYTPNKKLIFYSASHHSLYKRPFRLQLHREFKYLAQRANITDYYTTVAVKSSVDLLKKMGFSFVAYEKRSPTGSIKIGKYNYSRAIMHIKTVDLLAQPEFMNLLTQCKFCASPCSISSTSCCQPISYRT
ncbi:helix-turn-helix domain-containing protein [Vibrio gigantis]